MDKITLMISSVGKGLEAERDAIQKAFQHNELVELQGVAPYNSNSFASSSSLETIKIAEDCDLYILVLTEIFGFELEDGKSATEVEFDAAFRKDPTKVLVFLKDFGDVKIDEKQKAFIDKVSNYYTGYWRSTFKY